MKQIVQFISLIGLFLTILPPVLFFRGTITHSTQNWMMLLGAFIWFLSAYFWLGRKWKSKE